ncbi:MAG: DUF6468 domain-containing protein [Asticcacaulis sp.]
MSAAGIIMDLLLMGLLLTALWFGVRLNGRLKALKAGQEGFAKAVAELDNAAIKAFTSLKDLRTDADESQELLHGRILAARDLIQKLEVQIERAERVQTGLQSRTEVAPQTVKRDVRDANDRFHNPVEAEAEARPDVSEVGLAAISEMLRTFARPESAKPDISNPVAEAPRTEPLRPAVNPSRRQPYPGEDDLFDTEISRPRRPVSGNTPSPETPAETVPETSTPPSAASLFRRYR